MKRHARGLMWTAVKSTDRLGRMAYGLGWQLRAIDGVKIVGHSGGQQGTNTMLLIAPERRAGVVVLTNSDAARSPVLAREILAIVLGQPATEAKEVAVDPEAVKGYLGTYRLGDFKLTFAREDGRWIARYGKNDISLIPRSPREYGFTGFDTQLVFEPTVAAAPRS